MEREVPTTVTVALTSSDTMVRQPPPYCPRLSASLHFHCELYSKLARVMCILRPVARKSPPAQKYPVPAATQPPAYLDTHSSSAGLIPLRRNQS